jgi:hypothetical protein
MPARYSCAILFKTAPRTLGALYWALLLRLLRLCLLLHHRSLLGTRSGGTTRQNESRHRKHQNALFHFTSSEIRPSNSTLHA